MKERVPCLVKSQALEWFGHFCTKEDEAFFVFASFSSLYKISIIQVNEKDSFYPSELKHPLSLSLSL